MGADAQRPLPFVCGTLLIMNRFSQIRGFSLNELMVAIAIIAILASVIYVSFVGASGTGRDTKRQADLRNLQVAIEQYNQKYGRYPAAGCISLPGPWRQEDTCPDYVTGLTPEFMSRLPRDSRGGSGLGYAYRTNAEGTVYKLVVDGTVESETVTAGHPFYSCSTDLIVCDSGCTGTADRSYGVWGGFALQAPADQFAPNPLASLSSPLQVTTALAPTRDVICSQP